MNALYALAWAPFSFLLHNVIHEGAHALVAVATGGKVLSFWPFPSKKIGRFTWAHVVVDGVPAKGAALMYMAPLIAETLWVIGATVGFVLLSGPERWICLVEMISSNVDMGNWLSKLFLKSADPNSDALQVKKIWGDDRNLMRLVGVFLMLIIAQVGILLKVFA